MGQGNAPGTRDQMLLIFATTEFDSVGLKLDADSATRTNVFGRRSAGDRQRLDMNALRFASS
jgi:hypothetical protein